MNESLATATKKLVTASGIVTFSSLFVIIIEYIGTAEKTHIPLRE